jgi:hypothetical protein
MKLYKLNPLYWLSFMAFGIYAQRKDIEYIEKNQKDLLTLVKVLINPKDAGDILDKYQKDKLEDNDGK